MVYVDQKICDKCYWAYPDRPEWKHYCPDPEYAHRGAISDAMGPNYKRPTLEDLQKENLRFVDERARVGGICSTPGVPHVCYGTGFCIPDAEKAPIRKFETGATRDTDSDKYDYEGFLSPVVLEAYGRYMHKHRFLPNGDVRASDNWQKHFGENHYSVCTKSLWRHFMDLWSEHRGLKSREGIEDALMGILFNTMAYADKYLKEKKCTVT